MTKKTEEHLKITATVCALAVLVLIFVVPWLNVIFSPLNDDVMSAFVINGVALFILAIVCLAASDIMRQERESREKAKRDRLEFEQAQIDAETAATLAAHQEQTLAENPPVAEWTTTVTMPETVARDGLGNELTREDFGPEKNYDDHT